MESRLPKPTVNSTKTVSTVDVDTKMDNQKVIKGRYEQPHTSSNGVTERLKKAKSTININAKCTNENKPPLKQSLTRSKTMTSITTKAVKRPATTAVVHGEAKKPFTRPQVKSTVPRTGTTLTNNIASKSSQSVTTRKVQNNTTAKALCKWDVKGRLAQTHDELSNERQKCKEASSKCNELQEQVNSLMANENAYKSKAEKYEIVNTELEKELEALKGEISIVQGDKQDLTKRLTESEESLKNVSNMLAVYKEKCASQETVLQKHEILVKDLQTSLEVQRKINEELSSVKNELQSLVHTMDKDRRNLHNAIQEMKGNIRVFCRVRPRTSSELGRPYV